MNWDVVRRGEASGGEVAGVVTASDDTAFAESAEGDDADQPKKEVTGPLTIGLIGQPNVGKSSVSDSRSGLPACYILIPPHSY